MSETKVDALYVLTRLVDAARHGEHPSGDPPVVAEGEALLRQLQEVSRRALDSVTLLQRLERFTGEVDANVSIGRRGYGKGGDWVVVVDYGHEAETSPMVGASAIGSEDTLEAALEHALGEARAL